MLAEFIQRRLFVAASHKSLMISITILAPILKNFASLWLGAL